MLVMYSCYESKKGITHDVRAVAAHSDHDRVFFCPVIDDPWVRVTFKVNLFDIVSSQVKHWNTSLSVPRRRRY